ncbi:protein kinase [Myxococcota bacterium]|nr:protein kinase [Myxococcota bacterium]
MTERLGRYQLMRSLAAGGMGEIFLAEHTGIAGFAKRVALKRIRPTLANDPSYVQLFLNEARIGSFLNHPNIVHIFDVGHEDGALWLVMEYVDGVDLKRLTRRAMLAGHPLPTATVAAIMVEVLSALEEAHAGGPMHGEPIIHRDMSPENILVARSGAVKVLDFGLAKWAPGQSSVPSLEGSMIFGKVRYMPPEQLRGHLIDVRADLFALGVVMYETLAGALPFGSGSSNQVLAQILAGPPPSPTTERYGRDSDMDRIIQRAIDKDPARRFQTAEEMREALVGYVRARADALPLEGLRRMLRPGHMLGGDDPERDLDGIDSLPDAERDSPTKIALSVVERCGKCGGPFHALFLDGMIVDRCTSCRGVWLDPAEVDRILGRGTEAEPAAAHEKLRRAPLDRLIGSCPTCRIGLAAFEVPGQPAALEVCPRCYGTWFDRGELKLLRDTQVVEWLRKTLKSLGRPVDLRRDLRSDL